ncbi:hypothetical protein niasHS_014612 [Heterodera schachtii]|uniref:Uncharacterized protein n=1 Tax=Heterodera schachtii TaxID=97005 RepID=A0ABD2ILV5_HETSC
MSKTGLSAAIDDEFDPDIDLSQRSRSDWVGSFAGNPSTAPTVYAMFNNSVWTFMLVYGVTGRFISASVVSLLTMPATAALWVWEADRDYERWEGSRVLRERRVPKFVLPRTIFDWSDFDYAQQMRKAPTG